MAVGPLRLLGRRVFTASTIASACVGGVFGAIISVVVNNALIEISITPFFASIFGLVLVLLGSLMIWRKLWEEHQYPLTRILVLAFSTLVLCSGLSCFLLEKDWFKTISPRAKVPMYMMLGVSLCFAVSFSLVDLLNLYSDQCSSYASSGTPLVSSPPQIFLVLAGAVSMGAAFGLMFGAMDVEDDDASHRKLRTEERASLPIGFVLGKPRRVQKGGHQFGLGAGRAVPCCATPHDARARSLSLSLHAGGLVGGLNSLVGGDRHYGESGFGPEVDLLRAEGLLDD